MKSITRGYCSRHYKRLWRSKRGRTRFPIDSPLWGRSYDPNDETKCCSTCGLRKDVADFYKKKTGHDGYDSQCKNCTRATDWRRNLRDWYGLTEESYERMKEQQGGRCAICGDECSLQVDHNHETGMVRGLLCLLCNSALGHLKDNADIASRAEAYLRNGGVR